MAFDAAPIRAPTRRRRAAAQWRDARRAIGKADRADALRNKRRGRNRSRRARPGPAAASAPRSGAAQRPAQVPRRPALATSTRTRAGGHPAQTAANATSPSTTRAIAGAARLQRHHPTPSDGARSGCGSTGAATRISVRTLATREAQRQRRKQRQDMPAAHGSWRRHAPQARRQARQRHRARDDRRGLERQREIEANAGAQRHRQPERPAVPLGQKRSPQRRRLSDGIPPTKRPGIELYGHAQNRLLHGLT